ncbi:MAG TPA: nitroreductase/quinone reductase family protein [Methylomirabilota bacterium]|nr:nitroreductase/quinone reductase family protein [Methylomirabilota bacterium]
MGFSQDELDLIDRTKEVEIETSAPDGATHRTIIWVVVDRDSVFIRSYRGADARWYREALADPSVALHVDGQRLPATAVPATDADSIERTSAELLRKYAGDPATPRMVRPEVLDLTLRLERT